MTTPAEYVNTYVTLDFSIRVAGEGSRKVRGMIRNYLQQGLGQRSINAQDARSKLFSAVAKRIGKSALPDEFEFEGYPFVRTNLERVYMGKGAPDEIQDAIWMASCVGLVSPGILPSYCDNNLGIDCGGFAACYWGLGKPSAGAPRPTGWGGFLPRTFWNTYRSNRRKHASQIKSGDAIIFFKDVKGDNPDDPKDRDATGKWIKDSGSEAYHIGIVDYVSLVDQKGVINLGIAESSGGQNPVTMGSGVKTRSITKAETKIDRQGWVYHEGVGTQPDGSEQRSRLYFVGPPAGSAPYGGWSWSEE
jgi:hypothetical protein